MPRRTLALEFIGSHDVSLDARLELPSGEPLAFALFAHCFTCTKDIFAVARVSRALAERGIAVLRFDFTGLGGSGGSFSDTTFSSNVADLILAARYLEREYEAPKLLIGHSLGGTAVLAAAPEIPSAVAVCTVNSPFEPAHVREHFGAPGRAFRRDGDIEFELDGRMFTLRAQFIDDLAQYDLEPILGSFGKALLVLQSPDDEIVAVENGHRIFAAATHPKSFVALDGADHLLSRRSDAAFAAQMIAAWVARHLPIRAADAKAADLPEGTVVVREIGPGRYTQEVRAGRHVARADEPASQGGDDAGPAPYEYLLAGLGACTSMTVRMYAERKQWPLTGVAVRLTHERIHAEDCAECETKSGKIDLIRRLVTFEGDLDDEQRQRLLEIANKCPVHRTLTSEVAVRTEMNDAAGE